VFRLIVVLFCVMCVICVLCLNVVPLPPAENAFAVKTNNNNKKNNNTIKMVMSHLQIYFDLQKGLPVFTVLLSK
jgi:competence protein ComGC